MWLKKNSNSLNGKTLTTTPASTAYLIGPGNLRIRGGLLWWKPVSSDGIQLHPKRLKTITFFGLADVSGVAFSMLWRQGIQVNFVAPNGEKILAQVQPAGARPGLRRLQHLAAADKLFSLKMATAIISEKIESTRSTMRYYQRQSLLKSSGPVLKKLNTYEKKAAAALSLEQLLGIEGNVAKLWRSQFVRLLPAGWHFHKRSYRPSRDPVNALLSLGYTLITNRAKTMLATADLDPYTGFLHQIRPGRPSLACDLIEPLRVAMIDRWLLRQITQNKVKQTDFESRLIKGGMRLKGQPFRSLIGSFEQAFTESEKRASWQKLLQRQIEALSSDISQFSTSPISLS